jgi:hypothetical protein
VKRHSQGTPDSSARTDAEVKQCHKTIARLSSQNERYAELAQELVKKNNSDNELSAERERTLKGSLRSANKTIRILRIQCKDKGISNELLDALDQEEVPESTAKTQRLDEHTHVRDKMALREAAAGLTTLFDKANDTPDASADI